MSRNLKDLIDALEEKNQAHTDYEISVRELKEENERLKFTIKEQKILIEEQREKISKDFEVPEDIQLLKEVIVSQRQELNKKERDIEILENNLYELKHNLEISDSSKENKDLMDAQKLIIQLTEENEVYRLNESSAKKLIEDLTTKNEEYIIENDNLKQQLENLDSISLNIGYEPIAISEADSISKDQIKELKERVIMLEEEKEKLNRELQTAKITQDNLINEININVNEISELENEINKKNTKINVLKEKSESLIRQNDQLKQELTHIHSVEESYSHDLIIENNSNTKGNELLENLKKENLELKKSIQHLNEKQITIEKLKNDNINLNNVISELIQNQIQLDVDHFLPKSYQTNLFLRLYTILDNHKKDMMIKSLIQDLLNSKNDDIKRSIINLLSNLTDERVFNALLKTIHDKDWVIRLYTIISLNKFDISDIKTYFRDSLKELRNDKDPDVKEAASNLLNRIA